MKFLTITPKNEHLYVQVRVDGFDKDLVIRVLRQYDLICPHYEAINFYPNIHGNWFYIDLKEYGSDAVNPKILSILRSPKVYSGFEQMISSNSEVVYQYFMFREQDGNQIFYSVTSLKSTKVELSGNTSKYTVDRYTENNVIQTNHHLVTSHNNLSEELNDNISSIQDKSFLMNWMRVTSSMTLRVAEGIDK